MKVIKKALYNIKRFFWLCAVFVIRIVLAKRNFKVPIFKGLYFNIFGGFTSDQVALYNLNKKNKKDYLSEFDWYKSRRINYPNAHMLNDKLVCVEMIKDYVNTPKTLFFKKNNKIFIENNEINIGDAIKILKKEKSAFFKPISIGKGIGIFRIDYRNKKFYLDFKELSENKMINILKAKEEYFLSTRISQAKYLDNIYDKTSNTIRLITVRDKSNKVIPLIAVQRLGTKETIPVDNGSRGGIVSFIDMETGTLSKAKSLHNKKSYKNHPDSDSPIEGVVIPNWKEIKNEMVSVAEKLPQFKFIAWDILPTDNGIFVLEANNSSGVNIIQVFGGQRNKELGKFYKEQKIIR